MARQTRVDISGLLELRFLGRDLAHEVGAAARKQVAAEALIAEGNAKRRIQKGPKTGVVYVRRRIRHQASAPGQPPASDTGNLVSKIGHKIEADGLRAQVTSRAQYSDFQQFGTRFIKPRPFLFPTDQEAAAAKDRMKKAVEQAVAVVRAKFEG